ncbi:MAG: PEPxxWA-CTERM sorting domain-containing protein [Proteobacteria bacterium]|nr:PEPxxWA-CTERM sorting domain-containing protein [Pseudomonadota bacterium]
MRKLVWMSAAVLACGVLGASPALADQVTVQSTGDIWLSGQPDGTTATGFFGSDTAPDNSPVVLGASSGMTFSFTSVTGLTSVDGSCFAGADGQMAGGGFCYADESGFGVGPANGIGTYQGPADALIGVFLDASTPSGTGGPASLDYTDPANVGLASYAPGLNQIFYIGLGGNSFVAPSGATRLFLAVADSYGSSTGNLGALDVNFDTAGGAPEPAAWALVIAGFGLVGAALRQRREAPSA